MSQTEQLSNLVQYDPEVIKSRFIAAVQQTLSNLGQQAANHVRTQLIDMLGQWNLSIVATPEALEQVSAFVFKDETFRDWVLNTKFVFYMNVAAGTGPKLLHVLIRDLSIAASEDMAALDTLSPIEMEASKDATATPAQLLEDLPTASQALTVFASNTWLVVPLLMFAFVGLDHEVLTNPELAQK